MQLYYKIVKFMCTRACCLMLNAVKRQLDLNVNAIEVHHDGSLA